MKNIKAFRRQSFGELQQPRRTTLLENLLGGSPTIRAMLPYLRDQVILHKEKAIIWCMWPVEQVYVAAVLKEAGISFAVFHSMAP